jgi:hypothetical protein
MNCARWPAAIPMTTPCASSWLGSLFNTQIDAKAEEDLDRRDALLDELRKMASSYPDNAAVREHLAMALFNTLNDAEAEEGDLARHGT